MIERGTGRHRNLPTARTGIAGTGNTLGGCVPSRTSSDVLNPVVVLLCQADQAPSGLLSGSWTCPDDLHWHQRLLVFCSESCSYAGLIRGNCGVAADLLCCFVQASGAQSGKTDGLLCCTSQADADGI